MKLDWTPDPGDTPGVKQVTIEAAVEKRSKKGDDMIELTLRERTGGKYFDYLMLGGKGRNMGLKKLKLLGVEEGTTEIDVRTLIGKRLFVSMVMGEAKGGYDAKLTIDAGATKDGWTLGYRLDKPDSFVDEDNEPPF